MAAIADSRYDTGIEASLQAFRRSRMERKATSKTGILARALGAVGLIAITIAALVYLPVREYLVAALEWLTGLGPWGPLALVVLYVIAAVLFIPGTIITLGAGFAFGVVWGTISVSLGSTLGATAAFLLGRTFARGLIEERVARSPAFAAIDRAVEREGFKIVLLTRLSPVLPFNLLNYAYGLTRVSLRDYVLASWIGMFPATILYVYLGSAAKSLADLSAGRVERSPVQGILFAAGLGATVIVTIYVARLARRELQKAVGENAT